MRHKRGQSTLEYVIVLAAIIAVVTLVVRGVLTTNVTNALNSAAGRIASAAENF